MTSAEKLRHATLAGGVALGVFLCAAAHAKPVKHAAKPAGPSQTELELKAQVDALKAEVQALENRLDSQAQAQQQTQAQIQAAQAQAQAAQAQAQAAQTQVAADQDKIQTLPDVVKQTAKKDVDDANKQGWWSGTTVGATMFANVSGVNNFSNGVRQSNSGVDYDVKRLYLSVDHKFNNVFSADLTTDFTYNNSISEPPSTSTTPTPCPASSANTVSAPPCSSVAATQVFIKKAYLEAKLSPAFTIRAGASDLPWVPFVESLYGYRYVENELLDRTKFGTSTDWGLHVSGVFGDPKGDNISYQVSVIDGFGYKHAVIGANQPVSNDVDVEGRVSATYHHFTAGVGGYEGKLGKDIVGTPTYNTAERFDAVAAYVDKTIRVGVEYFYAKHWTDVTQSNPLLTNTSEGVGTFASLNINERTAIFGRYDYVEPQRNTVSTFKDNYFNLGVSYAPFLQHVVKYDEKSDPQHQHPIVTTIKAIDLALVYKREAVDNGLFSTSNGVIGGSIHGTYDEIGLFSLVKF